MMDMTHHSDKEKEVLREHLRNALNTIKTLKATIKTEPGRVDSMGYTPTQTSVGVGMGYFEGKVDGGEGWQPLGPSSFSPGREYDTVEALKVLETDNKAGVSQNSHGSEGLRQQLIDLQRRNIELEAKVSELQRSRGRKDVLDRKDAFGLLRDIATPLELEELKHIAAVRSNNNPPSPLPLEPLDGSASPNGAMFSVETLDARPANKFHTTGTMTSAFQIPSEPSMHFMKVPPQSGFTNESLALPDPQSRLSALFASNQPVSRSELIKEFTAALEQHQRRGDAIVNGCRIPSRTAELGRDPASPNFKYIAGDLPSRRHTLAPGAH